MNPNSMDDLSENTASASQSRTVASRPGCHTAWYHTHASAELSQLRISARNRQLAGRNGLAVNLNSKP